MATRRAAAATLTLILAGCGSGGGGDYFPLDAGRWWQYRVETIVLDEAKVQKEIVRNVGRGTHDGREVWVRERAGGTLNYFARDGAGVFRIEPPGQDGSTPAGVAVVLPEPLTAGASWTVESRLAVIESRTYDPADRLVVRRIPVTLVQRVESLDATVEVPAGRFEGCLHVRATGTAGARVDRGQGTASIDVVSDDWYAPGVGLVKSSRRETSDSTFLKPGSYDLVLESHGS